MNGLHNMSSTWVEICVYNGLESAFIGRIFRYEASYSIIVLLIPTSMAVPTVYVTRKVDY